jgi:REP element-mobilizing transposase RayT
MNVRTNHVHVVVEAPVEPEEAMRVLKARATRALREAGHFDPSREIWTRHGSTRYLWDERAVSVAVDYVLNRQ